MSLQLTCKQGKVLYLRSTRRTGILFYLFIKHYYIQYFFSPNEREREREKEKESQKETSEENPIHLISVIKSDDLYLHTHFKYFAGQILLFIKTNQFWSFIINIIVVVVVDVKQ